MNFHPKLKMTQYLFAELYKPNEKVCMNAFRKLFRATEWHVCGIYSSLDKLEILNNENLVANRNHLITQTLRFL